MNQKAKSVAGLLLMLVKGFKKLVPVISLSMKASWQPFNIMEVINATLAKRTYGLICRCQNIGRLGLLPIFLFDIK